MGKGVKMQCFDWPKAFHSTYTQIVVSIVLNNVNYYENDVWFSVLFH